MKFIAIRSMLLFWFCRKFHHLTLYAHICHFSKGMRQLDMRHRLMIRFNVVYLQWRGSEEERASEREKEGESCLWALFRFSSSSSLCSVSLFNTTVRQFVLAFQNGIQVKLFIRQFNTTIVKPNPYCRIHTHTKNTRNMWTVNNWLLIKCTKPCQMHHTP